MALFKQQGPLPQPSQEGGGASVDVALSNKLVPRDSCPETHALRLMPQARALEIRASRLVTHVLMLQ